MECLNLNFRVATVLSYPLNIAQPDDSIVPLAKILWYHHHIIHWPDLMRHMKYPHYALYSRVRKLHCLMIDVWYWLKLKIHSIPMFQYNSRQPTEIVVYKMFYQILVLTVLQYTIQIPVLISIANLKEQHDID